MKQADLDKSWNIMRAIVKSNGTLPKHIITKPDILIKLLGDEMNWSQKDTKMYVSLLIVNGVLSYDRGFIFLTEDGYRMFLEESVPFLKINFVDILPLNIDKETPDMIFYKIWDIIGIGKEDNPYYVDGKTFFNTIKRFISGLPPSYSAYTSSLQKDGKSVSRFDWGKDLFRQISKEEIIPFLNSLSEQINQTSIPSTTVNENEANELDVLLQSIGGETVGENRASNLTVNSMNANNKNKIFISHNTEDKEYAKALVNLLIQLGVNETDIFCSSLPGFGCRFGKSFIDEIKEQYEKYDLIMVFIHSPRYYNSHVSLCEMGASWILKKEHYSFLTKDCEFAMLDAVIPPTEIAFKAGQENTYHVLNEFKSTIEERFGLPPKNISRWETIKSDFIKSVEQ